MNIHSRAFWQTVKEEVDRCLADEVQKQYRPFLCLMSKLFDSAWKKDKNGIAALAQNFLQANKIENVCTGLSEMQLEFDEEPESFDVLFYFMEDGEQKYAGDDKEFEIRRQFVDWMIEHSKV